jgi:hypothetical protein
MGQGEIQMIKKRLQLGSVGATLLVASFTAHAASCPTGTSTVNFTWDGAAAGNKAIWNFNDASKTYTVNYTDTSGSPASVDIAMSLRDPANLNYCQDLCDHRLYNHVKLQQARQVLRSLIQERSGQ